MTDGGREMILLESDQHKNDPVINQHIIINGPCHLGEQFDACP